MDTRAEFVLDLIDQKSKLLNGMKSSIAKSVYPSFYKALKELSPTGEFKNCFNNFFTFKVILHKNLPSLNNADYPDLLENNRNEFAGVINNMIMPGIKLKAAVNDAELNFGRISNGKDFAKECKRNISGCLKNMMGSTVMAFNQTEKKLMARFQNNIPLAYYEFKESAEGKHYTSIPTVECIHRIYDDLIYKHTNLSRFCDEVEDVVSKNMPESLLLKFKTDIRDKCADKSFALIEQADDFKRLVNYFNNNSPTNNMKPQYQNLICVTGLHNTNISINSFNKLKGDMVDMINNVAKDLRDEGQFEILAQLKKRCGSYAHILEGKTEYDIEFKQNYIVR